MKNTARQPAHSTSSAPSVGAIAPPSPAMPPHTPIAIERRDSGNSRQQERQRRRVDQGAAHRLHDRPPMSTSTFGAMAASSEATANSTQPAEERGLRPQRSPSLPASSSSAANVMLYAVNTHDSAGGRLGERVARSRAARRSRS